MPKSETETDSGSDTSSGYDEESSDSSSSSRVPKRRRKSSEEQQEPVLDPREQFILPSFQPKPVKSEVSDFTRNSLRGPFLGQKMGRPEFKQLQEDYFCSARDYKDFSAPTVHNSPLALLKFYDSNALEDLTNVHNRLLFAMRVGLLSYERTLTLFAKWAPESTNLATGKPILGGAWATYDYKYKAGNVPFPVPCELRDAVSQTSIDELLARDFVTQEDTEENKMIALAKWALSYKEAYLRQQTLMDEMHLEAIKFSRALTQVHNDVDILRKDTGSAMRLMGSACQEIKKMREQKYTEALHPNFKRFLETKKRNQSPETSREERAGPLVASDLASEAKSFGKLKKVMDAVSKKKQRKNYAKAATADKHDAAKSSKKDKKDKKGGGGGTKNKFKGGGAKKSEKSDKAASNKAAAKKRVKAKKKKKDNDDSE